MSHTNLILFILLLGTLTRCAKQTQPTGGPKDETPPKLLKSVPDQKQINFSKDEIELTFDEHIQVNNPREQIIITPSVGKKFEFTARKNKALLKLNSQLLENTTYTISFREAVQDLSERNPAQNLKLAFSTGTYIDSLSISGTVYDMLQGKPQKNYTVAAVPYHDSISIFKHEARWITLTNDKGEFSLENLKDGSYTIYAFNDKNKNLIVDSKTEAYGFIPGMVSLDSSLTNIQIPAVVLDARELKLISARPIATYFNIRATKGINDFKLTPESNEQIIYSMPEDEATIRVYNTLVDVDSIPVQLHLLDSIGNTLDTTLFIRFDSRTVKKENFSTKVEHCQFIQNKSILKGLISFNKPVYKTSIDSMFIKIDSVNEIRFQESEIKFNKYKTELSFEKALPKETDFTIKQKPPSKSEQRSESEEKATPEIPLNQLIIPAGTFISIENDTSKFFQSGINTVKPESSGTIIVDVKSSDAIIVQIINKSGNVIEESFEHKNRFENLPPGEYQIRVIQDKNNNKVWDPGNYFLDFPPETITFYKNEKELSAINIKANWELGPLLINLE